MLRLLSETYGSATSSEPGFQGRRPRRGRASTATFTVLVFELERRGGVIDKDWRTPYLPNDHNRAWRWVDTTYQKHPWMKPLSRSEAASARTPPVDPGGEWSPAGDWEVQAAEGSDADGWQYAKLFTSAESMWGAKHHGDTVRRRMWVRHYVETKVGAQNAAEDGD